MNKLFSLCILIFCLSLIQCKNKKKEPVSGQSKGSQLKDKGEGNTATTDIVDPELSLKARKVPALGEDSSGSLSLVEKIKAESAQEAQLAAQDRASTQTSTAIGKAERLFRTAYRFALEKEFSKAQKIYLEACQYGSKKSCHKFGYYQQKMGNFENAIRFYKIACEAGITKSCNNLGFGMEQRGQIESAKDYYSRACIQHHSLSCQNLARVMDLGKDANPRLD